MRFRAGFRRVGQNFPTEYQLQYTWKSPVSPILRAEDSLHHRRPRGEPLGNEVPGLAEGLRTPNSIPQGDGPLGSDTSGEQEREDHEGGRQGEESGGGQGRGERGRQREEGPPEVPADLKPSRAPGHSSSPSPQLRRHSSGKKHHHCHHKKHHRGPKLISDYRAQFRPWPLRDMGEDVSDEGGCSCWRCLL